MRKLKVMTIVGTRPEIIRLACILPRLDEHFEHTLVHTGQNYDHELNQIFFDDLSLRKPDIYLDAAGRNGAETIGRVIIAVDQVLEKMCPEAILILGDTNSCLAVVPAKRRKIPTFHMEAGNRCFDMWVPEEINRRLVDHTADINLPYSSIAREYLLNEGLPADRVIKTGSPMNEVLLTYKSKIEASNILNRLDLDEGNFFVVSAHREENIESDVNFEKLVQILNSVAKKYELPVIVTTHPRTQNRIDRNKIKFHNNIRFLKPLGFTDYIKLQTKAKLVLSDSGTITEEASILKFSALNLRENHERPEGMEEAAVMMVGLNVDRVLQAITILDYQSKENRNNIGKVADYCIPNVSQKVVRIIQSYTDYVNRVVWKKY